MIIFNFVCPNKKMNNSKTQATIEHDAAVRSRTHTHQRARENRRRIVVDVERRKTNDNVVRLGLAYESRCVASTIISHVMDRIDSKILC